MKARILALTTSVVIIVTGCNTQTPGGAGVSRQSNSGTSSNTSQKPVIGEAEGTFDINAPSLATRVKQGETATATISISRGKNFDDDVALKVTELPPGVTVEPALPMIKNSDKDTTITFHAAADAATSDYTAKVLGHPTKGADATSTLKVTVLQK